MTKPKKSLGQHWLFDRDVLETIVKTANIQPGDSVLEVGPGLGTLSNKLIAARAKVTAVEKDEELVAELQKLASQSFNVISGDILKFDLTTMTADYKVVANIPYYLTSNLIRILSESANSPGSITLLVQKEVAERICARPGQMSLLSVSAQFYYSCNLSIVVTKDKFTPPPKVDSQVVHMVKKHQGKLADIDRKHFFRIVKAGFSSRRKTLLNSLSGGLNTDKRTIVGSLKVAGVSPGQRPQELSLEQWARLAGKLS